MELGRSGGLNSINLIDKSKTDARRKLTDETEILVFRGSYVDGLRTPDGEIADLISWCGLNPLSDEQWDRLWNDTSDNLLIENCAFADITLTHEIDEIPGQSDQFFEVTTNNLERLRGEVKEKILFIISGENTS